uniref:CSON004605 protein n=1 Tax=Culicoides sonorensis TaxID=179676 RepID=A0A336MQ23_CULSO
MFNFIHFVSLSLLFNGFYSSLSSPSRRIYGGNTAVPGQFPYYASLRVLSGAYHNCGGVILSKLWILTCAHCIDGYEIPQGNLRIVYGTIYNEGTEKLHSIAKTLKHENWREKEFIYDIGLIKLKCPIEFNENVQPVKFYTGQIAAGDEVTVIGLGQTKFSESAKVLQYLNTNIISIWECKSVCNLVNDNQTCDLNLKNQICTQSGPGYGICHADSGGPLTKDGKLTGLALFGLNCGGGLPNGYIFVSKFTEWIEKNTNSEICIGTN